MFTMVENDSIKEIEKRYSKKCQVEQHYYPATIHKRFFFFKKL